MTDLADFELRRARWRRALQAEGLDTVDQDDIALPGARCSSANAVGAAPPAARRPRRRADRDRRRVWAWVKNFSVVQDGPQSTGRGS
jgi:hypothetical protein